MKILLLLLLLQFPAPAADGKAGLKMQAALEAIYQDKEDPFRQHAAASTPYEQALTTYSRFWNYRRGGEISRARLTDKLSKCIGDLEERDIQSGKDTQKELILGLLYGIRAYINVEDSFFKPINDARRALAVFERSSPKNNSHDRKFATAASMLIQPLYFEDSFLVTSVLGFDHSIEKGLKLLDRISREGSITRTEATLLLIEYYQKITGNYQEALHYCRRLLYQYPQSSYFQFICAQNLYKLGNYQEALPLLNSVNNNLGDTFFPFHYSAIIMEAECLLYLGDLHKALLVVNYAAAIYNSGRLLELKETIVLLLWQPDQLSMPQDIIISAAQNPSSRTELLNHRNYLQTGLKIHQKGIKDLYSMLTTGNLKKAYKQKIARDLLQLLLERGQYSRLDTLIETINKNHTLLKTEQAKIDLLFLSFRSKLNQGKFSKAFEIFEKADAEYGSAIKDHYDYRRLKLLRNICTNYLKNRDN